MTGIVTEKRCRKCGGEIVQVYISKKRGARFGCPVCRAEYFKDYRINNSEKEKDRTRRNREKNKEKRREQSKAYKESHRKEYADYQRARKHRLRNGAGSFTAKEWQELCRKYGNKCLSCGKVGSLTADHVVPVIRGGSSFIDNIQPLCLSCNSKKRTSIIDYR